MSLIIFKSYIGKKLTTKRIIIGDSKIMYTIHLKTILKEKKDTIYKKIKTTLKEKK
jgi:hypothetical protein